MNKIGLKAGLIVLLVAGSLLLTNLAFAICGKGAEQTDPNKKAVCSCCCCNCCK